MNRAMIFKEEVLDSDGHTLYVEHFSNSMMILPPPPQQCSTYRVYVRFHKREDFADTMSAGVSKKKMYYSERDKMIMKPLKRGM